jgi:DNA-binding CsgD family transcriptional regulator
VVFSAAGKRLADSASVGPLAQQAWDANKDIATRLFVSPRSVETHLTHVYTKLGISSRVQLAQEAARRA